MGTKRKLAPVIGEVVSSCQPGALLDVFAGMCAVGTHIGPARQVWSNDLQHFSNAVANALFCSTDGPPERCRAERILWPLFYQNFQRLASNHGDRLYAEQSAIDRQDYNTLRDQFEAVLVASKGSARSRPAGYDLFTTRYGLTYFSVAQAMEIDSLRFAADEAVSNSAISGDEHRWIIIALAVGMNRCTTSPGHFAQPLAPKAENIRRISKERSRSIISETLLALEELEPVGSTTWRLRNKVFNSDANILIEQLKDGRDRPNVIYADPPYTEDQYSRYYHIYDTLVEYDYPICTGRGQYRTSRDVSDFCLRSKVETAFERLISGAYAIGADLVLSYPEKGLMPDSRTRLEGIFRKHYGHAPHVSVITHSHSTMGGSKGTASNEVTEIIYRAAA